MVMSKYKKMYYSRLKEGEIVKCDSQPFAILNEICKKVMKGPKDHIFIIVAATRDDEVIDRMLCRKCAESTNPKFFTESLKDRIDY